MESERAERARQETGRNRRLVVGLSLAAGGVGLVPVPLASDMGVGLVRAFLIQRLARRHGVTLSHLTALHLVGSVQPMSHLAAISASVVGMRLAWPRLSRALLVLFRFDDVARTFLLGTYFDYYCLAYRTPSDKELTSEEVARLGPALEQACSTARQHLVSGLFRKTLRDLTRAWMFVPRTLWRLALSAVENQDGDREVGEPRSSAERGAQNLTVEQVVEQDAQGFYSWVTRRLEQELDATTRATMEALCAAFDLAWAAGPQHETASSTSE